MPDQHVAHERGRPGLARSWGWTQPFSIRAVAALAEGLKALTGQQPPFPLLRRGLPGSLHRSQGVSAAAASGLPEVPRLGQLGLTASESVPGPSGCPWCFMLSNLHFMRQFSLFDEQTLAGWLCALG